MTQCQSTALASGWYNTPTGGASVLYYDYLTGGPGGAIGPATTPSDIVTNTQTTASKLVARGVVLDATMGELGTFHDANDYAGVSYTVLSGTAIAQPVVISPGNAVPPTGFSGTVPLFPALVGWV